MKLSKLTDVLGQTYLGLDVDPSFKDKNGLTLNDILEEGLTYIPYFSDRNDNLLNRNNNHYHITVFNVMECGKYKLLDKDIMIDILSNDIEFTGIGSIHKELCSTYFVPVKCLKLNNLRYLFNLDDKDLHITIAYTHKDLFGMPKNVPDVWSASSFKK